MTEAYNATAVLAEDIFIVVLNERGGDEVCHRARKEWLRWKRKRNEARIEGKLDLIHLLKRLRNKEIESGWRLLCIRILQARFIVGAPLGLAHQFH